MTRFPCLVFFRLLLSKMRHAKSPIRGAKNILNFYYFFWVNLESAANLVGRELNVDVIKWQLMTVLVD